MEMADYRFIIVPYVFLRVFWKVNGVAFILGTPT